MSLLEGLRIRRYYFNLYFWTQLNQQFRAFSGAEAHTIHRSLTDPDSGVFGPTYIHRLIEQYATQLPELNVLDAGCGYGGTSLDMHRRLGGRWHGITISGRQASVAARNAAEMGLDDKVTFARASYDQPADGDFTMVLAIESLIHAHRPEHTIANLCSSLRKDGLFIIVDDMPVDEMPDETATKLKQFKDMWQCPQMPSAAQWTQYLSAAGCKVEAVQDLSDKMRPRNQKDLDNAREDIRGKSWWRPWVGLGSVTEAELGGLILEELGREGAVRYQMIVARKC